MLVLIVLRESIKLCMDYYRTSRPDLIDYESCDLAHLVDNMNKVFQVVEEKFGIIRIPDPEDVDRALEEKLIMI